MNQQPAGPVKTVVQHLNSFRQLLQSLDANGRRALNDFWRDVRQSLNDQDLLVQTLTQQVAAQLIVAPRPPNTPARPVSSASVQVIRDTVQQALANEARTEEDASATIEEICDLDPAWAMEYVRRQINPNLSCINHELGCWVSGNAPSDNGYVKTNMRNTQRPRAPPGTKFLVQPFGHQMGIVARGDGPNLRLTRPGGGFDVCSNRLLYYS
jgi:hypothetical protein